MGARKCERSITSTSFLAKSNLKRIGKVNTNSICSVHYLARTIFVSTLRVLFWSIWNEEKKRALHAHGDHQGQFEKQAACGTRKLEVGGWTVDRTDKRRIEERNASATCRSTSASIQYPDEPMKSYCSGFFLHDLSLKCNSPDSQPWESWLWWQTLNQLNVRST